MPTREGGPLVPRSEREWRLYRRGFVEGIVKAQQDAACAAKTFQMRAVLSGVELEFPCWPPVQTSAGKAAFTPQLKKRRPA
jgi:hypothetical protein